MTKFRNMKIAITEDQQLDEVVGELGRLGFKRSMFSPNKNTAFIVTNEFNKFTDIGRFDCGFYMNKSLTALAELKEMG